MKRAKTLVSAAEHSVGSKEAPEAARMELQNLLNDMDVYEARQEELLRRMEEKLKEKVVSVTGDGSAGGMRCTRPRYCWWDKNAEFREIHEYYRTRKVNPLKKMQSVVAVACKVLRIFYAILTRGIRYDPEKLLGDIRRPQVQTA